MSHQLRYIAAPRWHLTYHLHQMRLALAYTITASEQMVLDGGRLALVHTIVLHLLQRQ